MSSIDVDISSFLRFAENMGAADDAVKRNLLSTGNEISRQGAQMGQANLQANDSVVTGGLLRDITARPSQWAGDTLIMEYGPNQEQPGEWVEGGRGAVQAREGGRLKFQIKRRGPVIYTKMVAAARPRPFMRPTVARLQPIAVKMLGESVMRTVNGML